MELQKRSLSEVYFPQKDWLSLRPAYDGPVAAPDFFLWGAQVQDLIYAWHPKGGAVSTFTHEKMPILVIKQCAEDEAFGLYIKTTFIAQPAHDTEWVCALKTLKERFQYNASQSGLPPHWGEALQACGLESHLGVLATRARYHGLSYEECLFLYERKWDLSVFEILEALNPALRRAFLDSLAMNNVSASQAKECLSFTLMLYKKMGEKSALSILTKKFGNGDEFRQSLLHVAQPELATLSHKRIEKLRALKTPSRTSVFGDPSFEKEGLKITHTPRNFGDWTSFKDWVTSEDLQNKMKELLEIYQ